MEVRNKSTTDSVHLLPVGFLYSGLSFSSLKLSLKCCGVWSGKIVQSKTKLLFAQFDPIQILIYLICLAVGHISHTILF
jgi:hypothetical protein